MSTHRRPFAALHPAEALEPRLMMSGNVVIQVIRDTLYIWGDKADNHIDIKAGEWLGNSAVPDNGWEIFSSSGTINGKSDPFILAAAPRNIRVVLRGGADELNILDCEIAGRAMISLGNGNDTLLFNDFNAAERITVFGGRGDDHANLNWAESALWRVETGSGQDWVYASGSDTTRKAVFRLGRGDDILNISKNALSWNGGWAYAFAGCGSDELIFPVEDPGYTRMVTVSADAATAEQARIRSFESAWKSQWVPWEPGIPM